MIIAINLFMKIHPRPVPLMYPQAGTSAPHLSVMSAAKLDEVLGKTRLAVGVLPLAQSQSLRMLQQRESRG
jgi:hypothetical protein